MARYHAHRYIYFMVWYGTHLYLYVLRRDITPIDTHIFHMFHSIPNLILDVELLKSTIQTKANDIQQQTGEEFDIEKGLDLSAPLSVIPTCWLTLIQNEDAAPDDHPTFLDLDQIFKILTDGSDDDLAELEMPEGDSSMFKLINTLYT